jgi:enoyl-CoA hydratase/carnithine racemase
VDKVVPAADLINEATALATALAKRPPLAVAAVLDGMNVGLDKGFDAGLKLDIEWSNKLAASKDAMEGITAFLEKREPNFIGE